MDTATISGLFDELEKIAGVGVNIHGYWRDPEGSPEGQELSRLNAARAAVPYPEYRRPGFLGRLFGSKGGFNPKEMEAYKAKMKEIGDAPPEVGDKAYEFSRGSRISTPYDEASARGYKVHSMNLISQPAIDMTTDAVYSRVPRIQNLSRDQLQQLAAEYEKGQSGKYPEEEKAFVGKIKHLLKNKKLQFGRLEYE